MTSLFAAVWMSVALAAGAGGLQGDPLALLETTAGEWDVEVVEASGATYSGRAVVTVVQDGKAQHEIITLPSSPMKPGSPISIMGIRSYDRFRKVYRFAYHDSLTGLLDVYEGNVEGGQLVLTNLATGTSLKLPDGREAHTRLSADIGVRGFVVTLESSLDAGATWMVVMTSTYRPVKADG